MTWLVRELADRARVFGRLGYCIFSATKLDLLDVV